MRLLVYGMMLVICMTAAAAMILRRRLSKKEYRQQDRTAVAVCQLQAFSDSFRKLSQSFDSETKERLYLNETEKQAIFDAVTEAVCKDCSRCSYCWDNLSEESSKNVCEILDLCEKQADIGKKDLPKGFRQRCVRADGFLAEARRLTGLEKTNLLWKNKLLKSRQTVAGQFNEVAAVISDFSKQIEETPMQQENLRMKMKRSFWTREINVRRPRAVIRPNGRPCVYIEACSRKKGEQTSMQVADVVSRLYGGRYRPTPETPKVIGSRWRLLSFEEDVQYKALTGSARMVRMGERVSGDSYTIMELEDGQLMMSISDGMGSGEEAHRDSSRIIELMEQMMAAGFSRQSAIQLLHTVVLAGGSSHTYSTLDLCAVDLFSGSCEFIKMGAAASFLKKADCVCRIDGYALPPGASMEADADVHKVEMQEGDLLIMVSDGVLSSLKGSDNEQQMVTMLSDCNASGPQELANAILSYVMACCQYEAADDMTILVCGIYKKQSVA